MDYSPQTSRSDTSKRILDATILSLAKNGFANTSVGKLAHDLEFSKGVISYHFPTKESLFQETIAYIYEVAFDDIRPSIDAADSDWDKVEQFIRGSITFYHERYEYVMALRELIMNFRPVQHRSYAIKRLEQEHADVSELLIAGQQKGAFNDFDPAVMAVTLRQAINGVTASVDEEAHVHHADELVKLFRRGIVVSY